HLTFPHIEAAKIRGLAFISDERDRPTRAWNVVEERAKGEKKLSRQEKEVAWTHVSPPFGRTVDETTTAYNTFGDGTDPHRLLRIIYHLGSESFQDDKKIREPEVHFSAILRERVGHHFFGEKWANKVKQVLAENDLHMRPLHIISANMH